MRGSTPSVQISVVALMTCALVRLTLGLWDSSDENTLLLLVISERVLATAAFAAVIPFVLSRLPAWGRAGLAVWGASLVCALYSAIWIAYVLRARGAGGWIISDLWFVIDPVCLAIGLAIIAIATVRGVATAEEQRPRGLEYAAFGVAAAGATAMVAELFLFVAGPSKTLELMTEICIVFELVVLAGILALARARIAVKDLPEARTLN